MSFGYVIDFACGPKDRAGGTLAAATCVSEGLKIECDASCEACEIAGNGTMSCIGVVPTPLSSQVEHWLLGRLPERLETVSGQMLKLAVVAGSVGDRGGALREAKKIGSDTPLKRSWGTLFRRFTVTTDQLIEQLFCVGDIEPPHGMAQLVQLGALAIDGRVPQEISEGGSLSSLVENPETRRSRTQCTVTPTPSDEPSVAELKRFLRALHAAFCLDRKLLLFQD